jgi:hypothetical protein
MRICWHGSTTSARRILVCAILAALLVGAASASAAAVTVCPSGCAFSQIAPAIAAANPGDTITVAAGHYDGGFTIDKSVKLVGAGAGTTIIEGGGPVITIGVAGAPTEPTVTIDGVTVTGGHTVGNLLPWRGKGGGIYIPRAAGPSTGATVTIRNSVIRGNHVAPAEAVDSGLPCDCPFADASGGGISNDGNLTLEHTVVADNVSEAAGGLTSDAEGGGIINRAFGNLTLKNSVVSGNGAVATPPNGRFADSGGIYMIGGELTVVDSQITNNRAELSSAFPSDVDQLAIAGGVHVTPNASATIRGTTISGNSISAFNAVGDANAFSGGLHTEGLLVLRDSTVSNNHVSARTAPNSTASANGDSGAGELNADATISNTRITDNTVDATSSAGAASAAAGASVTAAFELMTISDSVINGNRVTATATTGSSTVDGGGIANLGVLTLRNTSVSDNSGSASAQSGLATGGGLSNHSVPNGPPAVRLTLVDSGITDNTLAASPGITTAGGGLFTLFPVTLKNTLIAHNDPDDCFGC